MRFENFIYKKKKRKFLSIPSFLHFGPLATLSPPSWPGLLAQVPPRPARLPLFLPPPVPSWAGPASRPTAAAPFLAPSAADRLAPPASTFPHLPQPPRAGHGRNHPCPLASTWERPSSAPPASTKGTRTHYRPPCCSPRSLSHRPCLRKPPQTLRRDPPSTSARAAVSEPSPPPIFARGELAVVPSLSPCVSFRVSWLIAPNPRAP